MSNKKSAFRADAFRNVLGFTFTYWRKQPARAALIAALVLLATLAEALSPLFAGHMVDAVASGNGQDGAFWTSAVTAFLIMSGLYLGSVVLRQFVFFNIITFTRTSMSDVTAFEFHRVLRFCTEWHAYSFAGSTVR